MIKVTIGNNVKRTNVIVAPTTTLREVLEANDIDYTRGTIHLDGASLKAGEIDKTFQEMNVTDKCFLLQVVKADNA